MSEIIIGSDAKIDDLIKRGKDLVDLELKLRMDSGKYQDDVTAFMKTYLNLEGQTNVMEIIKKAKELR